ncbi:class I SAM-dependent methyltransferase [Kangiella sp.]|uniref:class I SAM-dependent methyltransferase n=1 Tax=Kangiella sp. TaxID=1920245 RepID=UPI0019C45EC4|nr:class I SAM-dependent methyltransferase [Kangiella sp.]MBD3652733.1 methyltransferase domain-containing protein [Kangiella sp.]
MSDNEKTSEFPYIHGFSEQEQQRLREQSRFSEHHVYKNVDFSNITKLLEVGCGVGAQSEILLRRFPDIQLTGIDFSEVQLSAADKYLSSLPVAKDRYQLFQMDATNMDFKSNSFEGAFLCWVLEHIPDPARVLSEVRRVLQPGGIVYVNEVQNSTFFMDPYSQDLQQYWLAFNDHQKEVGGDPFIGAKLGNLLLALGYQDIQLEHKTWLLDNRSPDLRKDIIEYWTDLLLSAAPQLIEAGKVSEEIVAGMKSDLRKVKNDPNAVFYYSFVQAKARAY